MKLQFVTLLILATAFSLFRPEQLYAQTSVFCVERAMEAKQSGQEALALAPSEAGEIIALVSTSIGLNRPIQVVPCDELEKGKLAEVPRTDVVGGDFITIDTISLKSMLNGETPEEAFFIIAHELAHILNADWSAQTANDSRKQKEDRADIFGACAVARLGGDWNKLEIFLKRLRHIKHKDYSLYADISAAVRQQFFRCVTQPKRAAVTLTFTGHSVAKSYGVEMPSVGDATYTWGADVLLNAYDGLRSVEVQGPRYVSWIVNGVVPGDYRVEISYASGVRRPLNLYVDNEIALKNVADFSTGSWTRRTTRVVGKINLSSSSIEVKLDAVAGASWPHFAAMWFIPIVQQ